MYIYIHTHTHTHMYLYIHKYMNIYKINCIQLQYYKDKYIHLYMNIDTSTY